MNILHITINPISMERRIYNQINAAQKQSHIVSVMYLENGNENIGSKNGDFLKIPLRTPFYRGGPLKFLHYNWKVLIAGFKCDFDVIHAHDLWILPAATLMSILKRKKLIYDAHEYYPGLEIFTRRKVRKWLWIVVEKICIKHAVCVITVSQPLAKLYGEKYRLLKPVEVIRNVPGFEVPDPEKAVTLPDSECAMTVLFHGHFRPGRGLINLIKAVARVEKIQLVLLGGGELETELKKLVIELGINERVIFIPYISTDRLISTAAQADLGIVLFEPGSVNYAHALPNKFFEYIMAGLPVLASNIDTFNYYVNKYHLGVTTDPYDIEKISENLLKLRDEPEILKEWHKSVLLAARDLNWENESEKLIAIYDKI